MMTRTWTAWMGILAISACAAWAAPQPGDVFREYVFSSGGEGDGFHRITSLDVSDRPWVSEYPTAYLPNTTRSLTIGDLQNASRAEVQIELVQGHRGTHGHKIKINGHSYLYIPAPTNIPVKEAGVTGSGEVELHQSMTYPTVEVPLSYLNEGNNTFVIDAEGQYKTYYLDNGWGSWTNWGQSLYYGVIFRIYYTNKTHAAGAITAPAAGSEIGDGVTIQVATTGSVSRVDFLGLYEGVNWEGDNIYRQWKHTFRKGAITNHIGSDTAAPYSKSWDMTWVPNQNQPIALCARVVGADGLVSMTPVVDDLWLVRHNRTVKMYKNSWVPEGHVIRNNYSSRYLAKAYFDYAPGPGSATSARGFYCAWSKGHMDALKLNGNQVQGAGSVALEHAFSHESFSVNPSYLTTSTSNMWNFFSSTEHHGIEVNWPGATLLVEFDGTEYPRTVATPVITPPGGTYYPSAKVYLSCATTGATIRYTTNGSDPTSGSTAYTGPITVSGSQTVKARAFFTNHNDSAIASAAYTIQSNPQAPDRVVMFVIDSLNPNVFDRFTVPNLNAARAQGVTYTNVFMPLPMHIKPPNETTYPWNCSIPNPVLMSGTVMAGIPNLYQNLLQHKFTGANDTSFVVDDAAYQDSTTYTFAKGVVNGIDHYQRVMPYSNHWTNDYKVVQQAQTHIQNYNPKFIRVHLQGPGTGGYLIYNDGNPINSIWDSNSTYEQAIENADDLLGDFIDWLDSSGRLDNTVLMIVGDNGQADEGWHEPYEEWSDRTSLIVFGKGIRTNKTFAYAEHIDIAPTVNYLLNTAGPTYSQGRVLDELLAASSDTIPSDRWMQRVNTSHKAFETWMVDHADMKTDATFRTLSNRFARVEEICLWDESFESLPDVVANNEQILSDLNELVGEGGDTTAPSVPTGLRCTQTNSISLKLVWTASTDDTGVAGYRIYRGGTEIGTSSTTNYTATGLSPNTAYSFTVSAYDAAANESAQCASLNVTTIDGGDGSLPSPWQESNVGSIPAGGSLYFDGVFDNVGAGKIDSTATSDSFHFIYQLLSGDGEISAHVTGITASDAAARAGVMIRESLYAGSKHAFMATENGSSRNSAWRHRPNTDANNVSSQGSAGDQDRWVRIVRSGNTFTAYEKEAEGDTWSQVGSSASITMSNNVLIGLAFMANSLTAVGTGVYESVSVSGGTQTPVATPVIAPNGGTIDSPVVVTVSCSTAGATIYYTTNGTTPTAASPVYTAPFTIYTSATVKAFATNDAMADSSTATATFTWDTGGGSGSGSASNLLAYWPMNEGSGGTAADASGNNNDASVVGAAWSTSGKFEHALDFEKDDSTDRADLNALNIPGNQFTIMGWVNPESLSTSGGGNQYARIIAKTYAWSLAGVHWSLSLNGAGLEFGLKTGGDIGANATVLSATGTLLTNGAWGHVAATYDGSTMRLYHNGVQVASGSKSGDITQGSASARIGSDANNAAGSFDGLIDEVRIYTQALAQVEIQAAMADDGTTETVATPTFAPAPGSYETAVTVTISCATSGAEIRYTTNGVDPTAGSSLYAAPVVLGTSAVVKARAYKTGMNDSGIGSAAYTITGAGGEPPAAGERPTWTHYSSSTGDIPAPAGGSEQTMSLVGDFNGDGLDDFIVGSRNTNAKIELWLTRGGAAWDKFLVDNLSTTRPEAGGAVWDVDGDGDLDIVVGQDSGGYNIWWFENPAPSFSESTPWNRYQVTTGGKQYHDMLFADVDGDGAAEFIFWNQVRDGLPAKLYVAEIPSNPKGTSSWSKKNVFTGTDYTHEGLDVADIDLDGDLDIAGSGYWFGNQGGVDDAISFSTNLIVSNRRWTRTMVADLVEGGRPEVIVANGDQAGTMDYYEWNGSSWDANSIASVGGGHSLRVADIDHDGHIDIFNGEMDLFKTEGGKSWVWYGDGAGAFTSQVVSVGVDFHEGRLADLNGDGWLDIVGKPFNGGTPRVDCWISSGVHYPLALTDWTRYLIDGAMPANAVFIEAHDLNGDGRKDLVAGGWWWACPGANYSNTWTRSTIGASFNNLVLGDDFDRDGDVDLLGTAGSGSSANRTFYWAENDGAGNFTVRSVGTCPGSGDFVQGRVFDTFQNGDKQVLLSWHNGGGGIHGLTVPADPVNDTWTFSTVSSYTEWEDLDQGDIDLDGDLDLLIGTNWLENTGSGWSTHVLGQVDNLTGAESNEPEPDRVDLADLDGDGDLDAVIGCEYGRDITWFENPLPTGTVTDPWTRRYIGYAYGQGFSMDVADMDNDGDPDVILGEHRGIVTPTEYNELMIFENVAGATSWTTNIADSQAYGTIDHHDGSQAIDFDGDGDQDIYSVGWYNKKVWLFVNSAAHTEGSRVLRPTFSLAGGGYSDPVTVSVATATSGAELRYTTDGSLPNVGSKLYSAPIVVVTSTVIKVAGFKSGLLPSETAVAAFDYSATYGQSGGGEPPVTTNNDIWIEAEDGAITGPFGQLTGETDTSGGQYVSTSNNVGANLSAGDPGAGIVSFTFDAPVTATYYIWGRAIGATGSDDSFHRRIDEGSYSTWDIDETTTWSWEKFVNGTSLTAGEHTLEISQREDGAKLDKLLITTNANYTPVGQGEDANWSPGITDTDTDGIDDNWEIVMFGNLTTANGTTDYDGDGMIDYHEFLAGTLATNDASVLSVTPQDGASAEQKLLQWASVSGKQYIIQRSTNLPLFVTVYSGIAATPEEVNTVTVNVDAAKAYYRIRLAP